jgi:signal transduction histidine kinase
MKTLRKYNRIRILMVVSQVMLLGLVIQWLSSQLSQERALLERELNVIYGSAEERVLDTMLFNFVISPVLSDTNIRVTGFGKAPSIQIRNAGTRHQSNVETDTMRYGVQSDDMVSLFISDTSISRIEVKKGSRIGSPSDGEDMVMRSVRMIVRSDSDSTGHTGGIWRSISSNIDSTLFLESFTEGLDERGLRLVVRYDSTGVWRSSNGSRRASFIIGGGTQSDLFPQVSVAGIGLVVFTAILPQIIFAVLLLLFTGTAFMLAFRSLKSQLTINRIRDEFISNISHELKTPVATVKLALEAIGKHDLHNSPETVSDYLQIAKLETERLDRLVTRVLDYGRMETAGSEFVMGKINLKEAVLKAVSSFSIGRTDDRVTIDVAIADDLFINGDQFYIESVIANLVDNSSKYCSGKCHISISAVKSGQFIHLRVNDNGPGIPGEYLSRVFEKFFRVPNDNRHNTKGHGLGLSFARMVIENHGGKISAGNLPEGGCSFLITLPDYDHDSLR